MLKPLFGGLVVSSLALLEPMAAAAAPAPYSISEITVPGSPRTIVSALNERGQVAGSYFYGDIHWAPFVYHQGSFTYPDNLGTDVMQSAGINEAGHIVGTYYPTPGGRPRGFAWIKGATRDIGDLDSTDAFGTAIDQRDIAYGESNGHAFASFGGHVLDLGAWPDGDTVITKVNAAGVAVGYIRGYDTIQAFMATPWSHTILPTLGGESAFALDINEQGVVCGEADTRKGLSHAYRYQDGAMTDLGTLSGGRTSRARAVNNAGDIVGNSNSGTARGQRAMIVRHESGVMEDLNTLANAKPQGWKLEYALDINDRGEIIGSGHRAGRPAVFLLTPRP